MHENKGKAFSKSLVTISLPTCSTYGKSQYEAQHATEKLINSATNFVETVAKCTKTVA